MVHKKNGKSKANQTTTLQQKNDANNVSATIKLAGKAESAAAEAPDSRNHAASEVIIQQQQVTIDKLLARIVKLEERVIVLEGGLASASHVTSVLQEQLTAKTDKLEMYSRRSCIVLTWLKMLFKRYARREYLKQKSLTISIETRQNWKN